MLQGQLELLTVEGEGKRFTAEAGSGHAIVLDDAQGNGGPRPMEAALLALGGCTAMDVISILRKKRQQVIAYTVELHAEQRESPPHYFTQIQIKHRLRGRIDPAAVRRAIELSETKYCSVSAMMQHTTRIEHSFEIEPVGEGEPATVKPADSSGDSAQGGKEEHE
jgi:putative redox protein